MGQLSRDTWKGICRSVKRQVRKLLRLEGPLPRAKYTDTLIAQLYFYSVHQDRPLSWAADPDNCRVRLFRPRCIPSRSQLARRVDSPRFERLLQMIHADLAGSLDPQDGGYLDGKPLTVSPVSKDKEAAKGRGTGGFAKGYKLHLWSTRDRRIPLWSVMPLNVAEQVVAEALIAHMPRFGDLALTMADGNYDSGRLYPLLALKNGALLVKPRGMDLRCPEQWIRKQDQLHCRNKGGGPWRQEMMAAWNRSSGAGVFAYKDRIHVEGTLSNLCSFGGGLGPLPAWVRGLERVRRWVGAKIILYHARLAARNALEKVV